MRNVGSRSSDDRSFLRNILFASALIAAGFAWAQPPSKHPIFLSTRFTSDVDSVGREFRGHECAAVARRLRSSKLLKTEFETDEEYATKTSATASSLSPIPGLTGEDLLAFVVPANGLELRFEYDAAQRIARIRLDDIAMIVNGLSIEPEVMLQTKLLPHVFIVQSVSEVHKPFIGQNAFGARVRADEVRRKVCAVAPMMKTSQLSLQSIVEVQLEPELAKQAKENLGVILIGTPAPPFFMKGDYYSAATIDAPIRLQEDGDIIPLRLKELWYFNKRTGSVIAKAKIEG